MQNLTKNLRNIEPFSFSHGGFAAVYRAHLLPDNVNAQQSQVVAVKLPDLRGIAMNDGIECAPLRMKMLQRWEREIRASQNVLHPNVLQILGFCDNPHPAYPEFKGLVLPFCEHGDARKYIERHTHADRMIILVGTAAAIFALHSADPPVVHGDIKAQNILIDADHRALLADFGLSRICETKGFTTQTINGSCRWMATELVRAAARDEPVRTTAASDVWSFGMTILEVLTGKHPFSESRNDAAVFLRIHAWNDRVLRPSDPCITGALWTLLKACWREDASARPDARHVGLTLDLIKGHSSERLDSLTISDILNGRFDNVHLYSPNARRPSQPYMCKWPHCFETFADINDLVAHECFELQERRDLVLSRL